MNPIGKPPRGPLLTKPKDSGLPLNVSFAKGALDGHAVMVEGATCKGHTSGKRWPRGQLCDETKFATEDNSFYYPFRKTLGRVRIRFPFEATAKRAPSKKTHQIRFSTSANTHTRKIGETPGSWNPNTNSGNAKHKTTRSKPPIGGKLKALTCHPDMAIPTSPLWTGCTLLKPWDRGFARFGNPRKDG